MNFLLQLLAGLLITTTSAGNVDKVTNLAKKIVYEIFQDKSICSRRVCMICAYVLENNIASEEHM